MKTLTGTKPFTFSKYLILGVCLALYFCNAGFAQIKVKILDADDASPLSNVPVKWHYLQSGSMHLAHSNQQGELNFEESPTALCVSISLLGFETKSDTIKQSGTYTICLKPDLKYLPEAVVTDQYSATNAAKSINKVVVIDSKKIKDMAANNLTDVLSNQLNVKLGQDNLLGSNLSLMGISGQNVKILMDGVPLIGRQNGNIDLSQINLNDIDRIEIIEGPLSVAYGTNALAGAINIITKKRQVNKVNLNLSTYNETVGRFNNTANLGLRKSNGVYLFSVGRNYFDGWSSVKYERFQEWKPKEQYFGRMQYLRKVGKIELNIRSEYFNEKLTNKGVPREPYRETAFDEYYYTRRWDNSITANSKLPKNRFLNLIVAYNVYARTKNRYLFNRVTLNKTLVPEANEQDTSQFRAMVLRGTYTKSLLNAKLNYQVGYDINSELGYGRKLANKEVSLSDYAAFLSMEYSPKPNWQLKPGFRYSINTSYKTVPLPSFNIKWSNASNMILRSSYSRGFRAPDLKELYLLFVDVNHNITGNPDLRAEKSNNYQFSISKKLIRKGYFVQPELSMVYNQISDRIVLTYIKDINYTYSNLDQFRAFTLNTICGFNFSHLSGNVGFSNNLMSTAKSNFSNPVNSSEFNGNLNYFHKKSGINFAFFIKVNSPSLSFLKDDFGDVKSSRVPSYTWSDLTLSKTFFKKSWQLGLGAKNIFDVTTLQASGNVAGVHNGGGNQLQMGMGRLFFIKLEYNFVKI